MFLLLFVNTCDVKPLTYAVCAGCRTISGIEGWDCVSFKMKTPRSRRRDAFCVMYDDDMAAVLQYPLQSMKMYFRDLIYLWSQWRRKTKARYLDVRVPAGYEFMW